MQVLLAYDWPWNVLELENCIEYAVNLGKGEILSADCLPERARPYCGNDALPAWLRPGEGIKAKLKNIERAEIIAVLNKF